MHIESKDDRPREGWFEPDHNQAQKSQVVRLALPVPLFRSFDYRIPDGATHPRAGDHIEAQFAGRRMVGVCIDSSPPDPWPDAKLFIRLLESAPSMAPAVSPELLELARWLSEYYHHPLGEVLATCLPATTSRNVDSAREILLSAANEAQADTLLVRSPRQRALYEHLCTHPGSSRAQLAAIGFGADLIRALQQKNLATLAPAGVSNRSPSVYEPNNQVLPVLTEEQTMALRAIKESSGHFAPFLLQGITGSGKTEVYLRAIAAAVDDGGQALLLVPEIGLTPQTIARVRERFPDAVTQHSGMTDRDRSAALAACQSGSTRVLVGTRSAVFAQFKALRLIIVDEEHDSSYKQQDGLRYSARDVAVKRAMSLSAPVVLGSATPSLESLHNVRRGRYQALYLRSRPGSAATAPMHIQDIRGTELDAGLSQEMILRMRQHLSAGGQVLTYINRRGFSPVLLCTTCNWIADCAHCDSRMTVHRSPPALVCHHCGSRTSLPTHCPEGHSTLLPVGAGTQRTEEALERLFPEYPVVRIDRDSTRSAEQMNQHLIRIGRGDPLILVGTQMLAKGHHFPAVTLVVVLNADGGFLSPDFRAPERTAQTIIQVAGRAGRAERPGEVWIQSLQSDNPALISLLETGYEGFANNQLDLRIAAGLPPASAMAIIRADALTRLDAVQFLESLKGFVTPGVQISGPAPAPIQRIAGRHRQQLLLLASNRTLLQRCCTTMRLTNAPRNLRWSIDIDPYDSM
ncbi:MAG: primosomal protein N' [Gammaproteobacteria bacterium]|nr:primosomal protein N' [Gammaproteobacteria bacterium]